jgi:hypothetical protein
VTVKYFNVKNGLTAGNIILDATTGNVTGTNFYASTISVTGVSHLGNIGNLNVTGGNAGDVITTDGAGNLSFASVSVAQSPAPMPIVIYSGETLIIPNNYQGLFGIPLDIEGSLEVLGVLIEV